MASRTAHVFAASEVLTATNLNDLPKGWLAYKDEASPPSVTTSATTMTSQAATTGASRLIKVTVRGSVIDGDNDAVGGIVWVEQDGVDLGRVHRHPDLSEQSFISGYVLANNPSAASHTYVVKGQCDSGEFTIFGGMSVLVEDIGPAS